MSVTSPSRMIEKTVTIAESGTVSGAADLGGLSIFGVGTPAALTGASFTFQVKVGSSYLVLDDGAGSAYSITATVDRYIPVDPQKFAAVESVKIVSASAEAAARTITFICRPL